MGRTTGFLQKGYTATTAIPARTLVKWGATDGTVVPAVAATDFVIGVASEIDTAIGERCSVAMNGNIEEVIYGGNVTRGDPLVAAAGGKAVVAAPGAGSNVRCIGYAEVSGVNNDIGSVIISPFTLQG
jgi:hypothetical protein